MQNVTYFPENICKNSLAIINYFGNLNFTSKKLYIEYCYDKFSLDCNQIKRLEMTKVDNYSFVLISVEDTDKICFQFVDELGNFDNNSNSFYQKEILPFSKTAYFEAETLIAEYKNSINSSSITPDSIISQNTISQQADNELVQNDYISDNSMVALVPLGEKDIIHARKGLRFSYRLNKRIKLLLIKLFRKLPSFITGNYRRRINL